jgi:hypothetical protein
MAFSATYYVSPTGNDYYSGTLSKPFYSIQYAYENAVAGDVIYLRAGTYREAVALIGKSGSYNKPITLSAYNGENAIISGLDVTPLSWSVSSGNVWVAPYYGGEFEQLFCNSKPMLEARWPNVPKDANGDWNFFSPDVWAAVDADGNNYGTVSDAHLAATGWNITGVRAVLNVAHQYNTWTRYVNTHTTGSAIFTYPQDLGSSVTATNEVGSKNSFNDDRYYLVGEKKFLDAPGEWYFDQTNNLLYFYPPTGVNLSTASIEVKTRNFSFTADGNSNYLKVNGITFFGTAFRFGTNQTTKSRGITFQNNQVLYSSCTDYFAMPASDTHSKNDQNFPIINADTVQLANNTFAYGSLGALFINGFGNLIENNVMHDFGYSTSLSYPMLGVSRVWLVYLGTGRNATVRYNTLYNSGGVLVSVLQQNNDVYQNLLYNAFLACWGGNKDVSALYTNSTSCTGTRFRNNWIHNALSGSPPYDWGGGIGLRGDDQTSGLTVNHNVVWNIGSTGLMIKNTSNPTIEQANRVYNNTVFQHSNNNPIKSAIIVPTSNNQNMFSSIENNMAETIYGGWFAATLGSVASNSNNSIGLDVESNIENIQWFDFRPKSTATAIVNKGKVIAGITASVFGSLPDIGAYERGDSIYFIPGYRESKASFPIVPNLALNIPVTRDALMWRQAYKAVSHRVYFGTNQAAVTSASTGSSEYKGTLTGQKNVYSLPTLAKSTNYFWRIDAVTSNNTVVKGDVWSFTTNKDTISATKDTSLLNQILVFPNPAHEVLNITSFDSKLREIEIYDLHGSLIKKDETNTNTFQLSVINLTSGMYVMKIKTENNNYVRRFVKQ